MVRHLRLAQLSVRLPPKTGVMATVQCFLMNVGGTLVDWVFETQGGLSFQRLMQIREHLACFFMFLPNFATICLGLRFVGKCEAGALAVCPSTPVCASAVEVKM